MEQGKICFGNNCFDADLAISAKEKEYGLMFKEKLDDGQGMLFVYKSEGKYGFWMKNTKIPLDIIWINSAKEVVFIGKNIQPCTLKDCPITKPDRDAMYVFEINAGMADKIGIEIGSKADFNLP